MIIDLYERSVVPQTVGVSMCVSVCWTTCGLISYRINSVVIAAIVLLVGKPVA